MASEKPDILLMGAHKPVIVNGLAPLFNLHRLAEAKDRDAFIAGVADRVRGIAVTFTNQKVDGALMSRLPHLEIVSTFGVGYDHIDAKWAGEHGIVATNTPEVLNEEVADTALGLLLCTVREFPQAERYLRAGKWVHKGYPLSKATLRDRTVGMVGMGRIGRAIARRLEAFGVPVVYHSRNAQPGVPYRHYPKLVDMAHDVDILMAIVPGGAATQNMINAEVLDALGPEGTLRLSSPAWFVHPNTTSSTSAGSKPWVRATSSPMQRAARSSARTSFTAPASIVGSTSIGTQSCSWSISGEVAT